MKRKSRNPIREMYEILKIYPIEKYGTADVYAQYEICADIDYNTDGALPCTFSLMKIDSS